MVRSRELAASRSPTVAVSEVELRVLDDPSAAAAELLAEAAGAGGHVALAGGTTVAKAYRTAAALAPDWSAVEVWWGDERAVPPDDERSNYRLVRETLLDHLEAPPRRYTGWRESSEQWRRRGATTRRSRTSHSIWL